MQSKDSSLLLQLIGEECDGKIVRHMLPPQTRKQVGIHFAAVQRRGLQRLALRCSADR